MSDLGPGSTQVAWESLDPVVGPGALYDVVTGSVALLRADAGFTHAACLGSDLADTPSCP